MTFARAERRSLLVLVLLVPATVGCGSEKKPPTFTGSTGSSSDAGSTSASASSGNGSTTSAASGSTGVGGGGVVGTLTKVLEAAPWSIGQDTTGIAVDTMGTVLVQDDDEVYSVTGSTVAVDLTIAELDGISGTTHNRFHDLDRDQNGAVYVLAEGSPSTFGTLLARTGPHTGAVFATLPELADMTHVGIATPDRMGLTSWSGGLWRLESGAIQEVHPVAVTGNGTGCATEDLAVQASGIFLYEVGCNGSPIVRGSVLGGTPDTFEAEQFENSFNFLCVTRDPKGGFYVMVNGLAAVEDLALLHVDEDVAPPAGIHPVITNPSVSEAAKIEGDLAFRYCSMATALDGTLFIQTFDQLWSVQF